MSQKIEALWDCAYCGQTKIGGLTKKCPNCGHAQDKNVKFYLTEEQKAKKLNEEAAKDYGKGADWVCGFCQNLNRYNVTKCTHCGGDRQDMEGDYFESRAETEAAEKLEPLGIQSKPVQTRQKRSILPLIGVIAVLAIVMIVLNLPKSKDTSVLDKSWSRTIPIEICKNVEESDWSVPEGGSVYDERQEIHHMETVISHYEDREVEKRREVLDGYDISYDYVNNGDGTFTEKQISTPRYRTETYYEVESVPVYVEVPVMAAKYYYTIDRWFMNRTVDTKGGDDTPFWGQTNLASDEREGARSEAYEISFTDKKGNIYSASIDYDLWDTLDVGDGVDLTVSGKKVTKINGIDIR